jgi:hypothetical protein
MEYARKGAIMNYNEKTKEWSINKDFYKQTKVDYSEDDLRSIVKDIASGLEYRILWFNHSSFQRSCSQGLET